MNHQPAYTHTDCNGTRTSVYQDPMLKYIPNMKLTYKKIKMPVQQYGTFGKLNRLFREKGYCKIMTTLNKTDILEKVPVQKYDSELGL